MGRPRRQHQAEDAAKAASDAARVLQQRSQAAKQETVEKVPETDPPEGWVQPKRYSEHRAEMIEEMLAGRPKAEPQEEPKPVEEPKPEVKAEPPQVTEKPAEVVATPPEPKTVKVKVDGEEFDVEAEEVESSGGVKAYQIQRAAENRLKKANEALAEVRRVQAEMEQARVAALKPKEPEVTDDQFIAERVDKIRFGTPEESASALKEILTRSNKTVDPKQIIQQATGQFWHDQAVRQFDKDFQDLVTNADLLDLLVVKRNKKLAQLQGAPADWSKFYSDLGNEVRSVVGKPTSSTTAQSTTSGTPSQQSKEERKAAAAVSVPASAARVAPPKEEKPETRADMIREMRKSRGLPVD